MKMICVERMGAWLLVPALAGMTGACSREAAVLVLSPARVSACAQPVALDVQWDATRLNLKRVKLEVNDIGRKPQTWHLAEARGQAQTGVWASDGFTVTLKAMNGVVLARRTLTTSPCPDKPWL